MEGHALRTRYVNIEGNKNYVVYLVLLLHRFGRKLEMHSKTCQ